MNNFQIKSLNTALKQKEIAQVRLRTSKNIVRRKMKAEYYFMLETGSFCNLK